MPVKVSELGELLSGLATGDSLLIVDVSTGESKRIDVSLLSELFAALDGAGDIDVTQVPDLSATYAALNGAVFTGEVELQAAIRTTPDTSLGTTGTLALYFAAASLYDIGPLTGDITFVGSNLVAGRSVTARIVNGATLRTLAFPAGWVFVGAKPADIAASKTGILTATAFGTTDADVVAAWAVEE